MTEQDSVLGEKKEEEEEEAAAEEAEEAAEAEEEERNKVRVCKTNNLETSLASKKLLGTLLLYWNEIMYI